MASIVFRSMRSGVGALTSTRQIPNSWPRAPTTPKVKGRKILSRWHRNSYYERGSSAVECRILNRESPGSILRCCHFKVCSFIILPTTFQFTQLFIVSRIKMILKIKLTLEWSETSHSFHKCCSHVSSIFTIVDNSCLSAYYVNT